MQNATPQAAKLGRVESLTFGRIIGLFSDYIGSNFREIPPSG